MKPAPVFAKYIYNRGFESNLKIQRLLYISFGFYGAYHDKFLFNDPIEAWECGPVIPNVYSAIENQDQDFKRIDPTLEEEEVDILNRVIDIYGKKAPSLLKEITYKANPPGSEVYVEEKINIQIEKKKIIDYYKSYLTPINALVERMARDDFRAAIRRLAET